MTTKEIGKLEDGQPDPCYDCKNLPDSDTACLTCGNDVTAYTNYKAS